MGPRAPSLTLLAALAACGPQAPAATTPDGGTTTTPETPAPPKPEPEPTTRDGIAPLHLDDECAGPKRRAEVIAYDDVSFVVAWVAACESAAAEVRVQRFDSAVAPMWPAPVRLSSGSGNATDPSLAVDNGDIFVAWHQSEGFPSMWLSRVDGDGLVVPFYDAKPACSSTTAASATVERLEIARPTGTGGYAARGAIRASNGIVFAAYVLGDRAGESLRVQAMTTEGAGLPLGPCGPTRGAREIATGLPGHLGVDGGDLEGDDDRVELLEASFADTASTSTVTGTPATLVLTYPAVDARGAPKVFASRDGSATSIADGVDGKPAALTTSGDFHLWISHFGGGSQAWLRPTDLSYAVSAPALDGARAIAAVRDAASGGLRGWIAGPKPAGVQRFTWADVTTADVTAEPMTTLSARTRIRAACLAGDDPPCLAVWTAKDGTLEADLW